MTHLVTALAVGLVAAAATLVLTRRHDVVSDEAWILVVASRLKDRHDVLYRDVFFGVAPLPMWLLLAATGRGPVEVAALRRLNAVGVGVVAGALWHVTAQVGLPWWSVTAVVVLTVLACGPVADVLTWYDNLSRAGVALALCLVLDGAPWALVAAGAALGAAAMSKYTVGVVASPVLLAMAWTTADDRRWIAAAALAALAVGAVSVAPLTRQPGVLRAMVSRLGPGKRSFVQHGRISLWRLVRHRQQRIVVMSAIVPLAVISLPAAVWASRRGAPSATVWTVLVGVVVFSVCTWPRADTAHLRSGLPFAAVAVLAGTAAVHDVSATALVTVVRVAMLVWTVWLAVAGVHYAVGRGAFRPLADRQVRGCRGAGCRLDDAIVRDLWVASELAGGVALVLGVDAPYASLVSGIHNPTPYDYPLASAFGVHGQADVAQRIADGRVAYVVQVEPMPVAMAPTEVDDAVATHTEVVWQSATVRLRRSLAQR